MSQRHKEHFSTRRVEALTDGVFAIAMTLLVLDLKFDSFTQINSSAELLQALSTQSESIASFIISFLLLGNMWAVHMRQFEYIAKTDRRLTMLNTIRLLAVVVMPLTTSIAGAYPDVLLARILFPLNFFAIAVLGLIQWKYATNPANHLNASDLDSSFKRRADLRNTIIVITAALVTILAAFFGETAFLLFLIAPILIRSRKRAAHAS